MINLVADYKIELLQYDKEAERLALIYIDENVIPKKFVYDGTHIALASIKELDFILSLNFKHINKHEVKRSTAYINEREGYNKPITICSPMEVIDNE